MFPFGGVVRSSALFEALQGDVAPHRPMNRWSISVAWVDEPGRINTAEPMGEVLL